MSRTPFPASPAYWEDESTPALRKALAHYRKWALRPASTTGAAGRVADVIESVLDKRMLHEG